MDLIVSQNHLLGPGQVFFAPDLPVSVAHFPAVICATIQSSPLSLRAARKPNALQQDWSHSDARNQQFLRNGRFLVQTYTRKGRQRALSL
jgi:hypothetical protein